MNMTDYLQHLIQMLVALPKETEWIEFKENNASPEEIGEYLSAIANSAALAGKDHGYIVWGVRDGDHEIVGTTFRPSVEKVKGQEIENWLAVGLRPSINFRIQEGTVAGKPVALFEIPAAAHTPVRFGDFEYIRVGSYKKKLRDHPEKERQLWAILSSGSFENEIAHGGALQADVIALLDHRSFFSLLGQQQPPTTEAIVRRFAEEDLLVPRPDGRFDIRNAAAILFARDLSAFGRLGRKAVRIVTYDGAGRTSALRERMEPTGYAAAFQSLLDYIDTQIPRREKIDHGLRTDLRTYPEDTIREPLGNALIHQDFEMTGVGPLVEIFADRVEITSPGTPLVPPERFLDAPPRSRNETLAGLMRRMRICEERGSGIDKVVQAAEASLLPAPDFRVVTDHLRVAIYALRSFNQMTKEERLRATYQHASLQWISNHRMTNSSLRKRFGISEENSAMVSRLIADALDAQLIKPFDPKSTSRKQSQYIPFWA
jgi:predicted HTH transcriptional regulator